MAGPASRAEDPANLAAAGQAPPRERPGRVPRLLSLRMAGPASIWALVIAQAVVWAVARPAAEPSARYAGQFLAAEAVLLLSIGLALVSTLRWVEPWFDGIDRAMVWHRRVAITAVILLLVHAAITASPRPSSAGPALAVLGLLGLVVLAGWAILPRWQSVAPRPLRGLVPALRDRPVLRRARRLFGGYERWRAGHRLIGLFVALGFAHALLDGTAFRSPVLRVTFIVVAGAGLAFYLYRELLARYFMPLYDYQVRAVRALDGGFTEIGLRPLGRRLDFAPGQFALLYLEAKDGWHRHPFTISSAPSDRDLQFTVKALGDDTSRASLVEPGMPAVVGGAHGRFSYQRGTRHQAWIAGGAGITPFLSWLRAMKAADMPARADFFYTGDGPSPWYDEIAGIAARLPGLVTHFTDTRTDPRLTPAQVLAAAAVPARQLSVFMCGPKPMLDAFEAQFRHNGITAANIHREHYDWR